MSFKTKLAAAVLGVSAAGAIVAGSMPAAQATTFKCIFSNGCGALHGVNAEGNSVAVDAKYQNPNEMVIGYPDLEGDSATNVSLVAHTFHTHTYYTIVFAKDGFWSDRCVTAVGDGKLRFLPCTLGRDSGQRFRAYLDGTGSPTVVNNLSGDTYAFRNDSTGGYLEDASHSNPAVARSDISDSMLPWGRQLDANGAHPTFANELWTWAA